MIVLDASVLVAWGLPNQSTRAARALRHRDVDFAAPDLVQVEIRNALLKAERRGLSPRDETNRFLTLIESVVTILPRSSSLADILALARGRAAVVL